MDLQLLDITITPMKYELNIEQARLELHNDYLPVVEIDTEPAVLKISTKDAAVKIDTYESRKSCGLMNMKDQIRMRAEAGRTVLQQQIRKNVVEGQQMAAIEQGMTIPLIIRQKMQEQPELVTNFLPSSGANITWEAPQISVDYEEGSLNFDWEGVKASLDYVPGSVRVRILEYASVKIEYLGSPMYIPKSAAPDWEPKE